MKKPENNQKKIIFIHGGLNTASTDANSESKSWWGNVISIVRTPLGVIVLLILVIDGIISAIAFASNKISLNLPFYILILLIVMIFIIMFIKPELLYDPMYRSEHTVVIKCLGDDTPKEWDKNRCTVEIQNQDNINQLRSITPIIVAGPGGWFFRLKGSDVRPRDTIQLKLMEKQGIKWESTPQDPDIIYGEVAKKF